MAGSDITLEVMFGFVAISMLTNPSKPKWVVNNIFIRVRPIAIIAFLPVGGVVVNVERVLLNKRHLSRVHVDIDVLYSSTHLCNLAVNVILPKFGQFSLH